MVVSPAWLNAQKVVGVAYSPGGHVADGASHQLVQTIIDRAVAAPPCPRQHGSTRGFTNIKSSHCRFYPYLGRPPSRQPGGLVVFPGGQGTQPKSLAFLRLHGSGFTTARAEQATTDYQAHQTDH